MNLRLTRKVLSESNLRRELEVREKTLSPNDPELADAISNLAFRIRHTNFAESKKLHKRALGIREKALGPSHPEVEKSLIGLSQLAIDEESFYEAEVLLVRAISVRKSSDKSTPFEIAFTIQQLGFLMQLTGRRAEAERLFHEAITTCESGNHGNDELLLQELYLSLAEHLQCEGRHKEAAEFYAKAHATYKSLSAGRSNMVERSFFERYFPIARRVVGLLTSKAL